MNKIGEECHSKDHLKIQNLFAFVKLWTRNTINSEQRKTGFRYEILIRNIKFIF
jgi:hypothetical protein